MAPLNRPDACEDGRVWVRLWITTGVCRQRCRFSLGSPPTLNYQREVGGQLRQETPKSLDRSGTQPLLCAVHADGGME